MAKRKSELWIVGVSESFCDGPFPSRKAAEKRMANGDMRVGRYQLARVVRQYDIVRETQPVTKVQEVAEPAE